MRYVGGNPNNGFEVDKDNDGGVGYPELDDTVAHSGERSIRISNPRIANPGAFTFDAVARPDTDYFLSAWFKSEYVLPTAPR